MVKNQLVNSTGELGEGRELFATMLGGQLQLFLSYSRGRRHLTLLAILRFGSWPNWNLHVDSLAYGPQFRFE